ncbi:hypothetical protein MMC07_005432 [Pseudocyphellaria aurata]|nr:hypothetical protein [Pseudocyphellaria aurata]
MSDPEMPETLGVDQNNLVNSKQDSPDSFLITSSAYNIPPASYLDSSLIQNDPNKYSSNSGHVDLMGQYDMARTDKDDVQSSTDGLDSINIDKKEQKKEQPVHWFKWVYDSSWLRIPEPVPNVQFPKLGGNCPEFVPYVLPLTSFLPIRVCCAESGQTQEQAIAGTNIQEYLFVSSCWNCTLSLPDKTKSQFY